MDIDGYKRCALGYTMPSAHGPCFVVKSSREKVKARIGLFLRLKSVHTDRLFVVISCEKISERTNRFSICGNVYDRFDYETHATDRL